MNLRFFLLVLGGHSDKFVLSQKSVLKCSRMLAPCVWKEHSKRAAVQATMERDIAGTYYFVFNNNICLLSAKITQVNMSPASQFVN